MLKPYAIINRLGKLIKDAEDGNFASADIKKVVEQFRSLPGFKKYHLSYYNTLIVAQVWTQTFEEPFHNTVLDILKIFYPPLEAQIEHLDEIISLFARDVLFTPRKKVPKRHSRDKKALKTIYSKSEIMDSEVELHHDFLKTILGEKVDIESLNQQPYSNNRELLDDWLAYVAKLKDLSEDLFSLYGESEHLDEEEIQKALAIQEWQQRIANRMSITEEVFPLNDLIEEYELDEKEITILIFLLKEELEDNNCATDDVIKLVSTDHHELFANKNYISLDSKLLRLGLVEISEGEYFMSRGCSIRIAPDIMRRVIMKTPIDDEEKLAQILSGNNIFTLVEPQQSFDDLVLPEEMKKTISFSLNQYKGNIDATLNEWGLYDKVIKKAAVTHKKLEPGMLMLFYGAPGTGKTFAAGAIAQALGKKLLVTDVSRIQSKWVGDSEKNVKQLFTIFEKIVNRIDNPPVLLLNEADQFLIKRMSNAGDAVDNMLNSLQNLFLEAFENMQGILIATTNKRENLDEAFSRRFHLKLEFPAPIAIERQKLWKLHLPSTIPGAENIEIARLAERFEITGGQIKIIVRNACIEAASRNIKLLTEADLLKYCHLETGAAFEKGKRKVIGF